MILFIHRPDTCDQSDWYKNWLSCQLGPAPHIRLKRRHTQPLVFPAGDVSDTVTAAT